MSRTTRKRILLGVIILFVLFIIGLKMLKSSDHKKFNEIMSRVPFLKNTFIAVNSFYCNFIENNHYVYSTDKCGGKVDCTQEDKFKDLTSGLEFTKVQVNEVECGPPSSEQIKKTCIEMGYTWNGANCYEIFNGDKVELDINQIKYDEKINSMIIKIKIPQGIKDREANKMISFDNIYLEIDHNQEKKRINSNKSSITKINTDIDNTIIFNMESFPYSLVPQSYQSKLFLETNIYKISLPSKEFKINLPTNKIDFKCEFVSKQDMIITDVSGIKEVYKSEEFITNVINTYQKIIGASLQQNFILNPNFIKIMEQKKIIFDLVLSWTNPSGVDIGEPIFGYKYNIIKIKNGKSEKILDRSESIVIEEKVQDPNLDKDQDQDQETNLEEEKSDIQKAEEEYFENEKYKNMYKQDLDYYNYLKNNAKIPIPDNFKVIYEGFAKMDENNAISFDLYKNEIKKLEKYIEEQRKAEAEAEDVESRTRDAHMDRFFIDTVYPGDKIIYILDIFPVIKDNPNGKIEYSSQIELKVEIPEIKDFPAFCTLIPNHDGSIESYLYNDNNCRKPSELDNEFYCTFKYDLGLGLYQNKKCYLAHKAKFDYTLEPKKEKESWLTLALKNINVNIENVELFDRGMKPRKVFKFFNPPFDIDRYKFLTLIRQFDKNKFDVTKFNLNNLNFDDLKEMNQKLLENSEKEIKKLQDFHATFPGRSSEEDNAWRAFQDAGFENNLIASDLDYFLGKLAFNFDMIKKGLVIKDHNGTYFFKDDVFNFRSFDENRYKNLHEMRRSDQIEEKDTINLNIIANNYQKEKQKAQDFLNMIKNNESENFYKRVEEEDYLLSKEEDYLFQKISSDQINYMKNKINKLFNPCTSETPICKKSVGQRTISLIKPAALGTISNIFLDPDTAPKLWETRKNFKWYTENQFDENTVIKEQNIEEINKLYFANKTYIDNVYEDEKLKKVYNLTKVDKQETISYNIEGECYNPKSDSKNCCNGRGTFNLDTGTCECKNGWTGESCERCGQVACN